MKTRRYLLLASLLLIISLSLSILALLTSKPARTAETFELAALDDFSPAKQTKVSTAQLTDGNLFHPLRGTVVPEKTEQDVTKPSTRPAMGNKLELTGIFLFGETRGAVITGAAPVTGKTEKNKNGQKRVYREGDSVEGGLVVQTIHTDHVVLIRGSEKQILQLHKKQEKKP